MDLFEKDPVLTRALALVLMRQAHDLLATVEEPDAARHLLQAIDAVRRVTGDERSPPG